MNGFVTIQGKVIGSNSIRYGERIIECWTNSMQAAVVPQPLDLTPYDLKRWSMKRKRYRKRYSKGLKSKEALSSHLKELQPNRLWSKPDRKN